LRLAGCCLGQGGEEARFLIALAAQIGVVEDQEQVVYGELVPVQVQAT
jgi:hypothetical protein